MSPLRESEEKLVFQYVNVGHIENYAIKSRHERNSGTHVLTDARSRAY